MIAYDKYPNQEMADKLGVKLVSQEEVLKKAGYYFDSPSGNGRDKTSDQPGNS